GIKFGYSKAQFNLGICYELGKGVVVDMKKTVELYRQAAHQGHPLALYNLAVYNYHGYGIPKNVKEGIELMEMAADSGVIPAHSFLGSYYLQTKS
ncbi:tetratricopeptide repeat protein, partial [Salmonella sp. s55004]|uniref:tetratricopeptide repeat protein n=1 Tax=Salmonella sp. s55004 TaxID=3159675 RepID=UPI00397F106E